MANYSETLTITLPANLLDIANAVARSLDPDLGGADSFEIRNEGDTTITVTTPCTPEFKANANYLLANSADLNAIITSDYATRWQGMTPPTLQDVQTFCAGIIL